MSALVPVQFGEGRDASVKHGARDKRKMTFGGVVRAIYSQQQPVTIRVNNRLVVDRVSLVGLETAPMVHWFRVEEGDEVEVEGSSGMGWCVTLLVEASALGLLKLIGVPADTHGLGRTSVDFGEADVWIAKMIVQPDDAMSVRFRVTLEGPGAGFNIHDAHGHGLNAVDPLVGFGEVRKGGRLLIEAMWPVGGIICPVSIAIYGRSLHG